MGKYTSLLLFQAFSSVISGVLITKMSFLGRIGVHTMYREYLVFRSWWKTALLLFIIQAVLILILVICKKVATLALTRFVSLALIVLGAIGLFFTYIDFTTTSHKLMKSSFHWGFYLFWIGWFISCLFFLFSKKPIKQSIVQTPNIKEIYPEEDLSTHE